MVGKTLYYSLLKTKWDTSTLVTQNSVFPLLPKVGVSHSECPIKMVPCCVKANNMTPYFGHHVPCLLDTSLQPQYWGMSDLLVLVHLHCDNEDWSQILQQQFSHLLVVGGNFSKSFYIIKVWYSKFFYLKKFQNQF